MPETGQLRVQTYASRAILPIEGSTVTIELENNGEVSLLAVRQTDESGLTQNIRIDTPDKQNSQQPDQARGWTNVNVTVSHPQYERVIIRDVQIFPDIVTQQAIEMIPLSQMPSTDSPQQYAIPPQNL